MARNSAQPTRQEILRGMKWRPICMKGVPKEVLAAENRATADYLVRWARGLAAHIEKLGAAKAAARRQRPLKM